MMLSKDIYILIILCIILMLCKKGDVLINQCFLLFICNIKNVYSTISQKSLDKQDKSLNALVDNKFSCLEQLFL